ncbi:hypothetical protein R4Z10_05495 [Niallia sp. XMNu-256]|uniref:hypothetical protein n=1 Tax=Niallia sp. XMNu-256 TaxID=3082444 RepID=UPI0030CD9DF6
MKQSEHRANEANLKLDEIMNPDNNISTNESQSVTDTNLELQNAFYGDRSQDDVVPTYVTTETAAIKIRGEEK